jgi:hypothetical protein
MKAITVEEMQKIISDPQIPQEYKNYVHLVLLKAEKATKQVGKPVNDVQFTIEDDSTILPFGEQGAPYELKVFGDIKNYIEKQKEKDQYLNFTLEKSVNFEPLMDMFVDTKEFIFFQGMDEWCKELLDLTSAAILNESDLTEEDREDEPDKITLYKRQTSNLLFSVRQLLVYLAKMHSHYDRAVFLSSK